MLKIYNGHFQAEVKQFLFPGGEVGVRVGETKYFASKPHNTIVARLQNANDILELAMAVDAVRRTDPRPIRLFMPYVPYARQDRVCNAGESHSLKVFAGLINAMGFEKVIVCDPHSDVVGAVFDRLTIISQREIIGQFDALNKRIFETHAEFVSPDAGAYKKTSELAGYFGRDSFIRADKLRDLSNGNIKETIVYADDLTGKTILIADDICDGGRTFVELAKVLKTKGAERIILYVTHGILSKGTKPLKDGGIDELYISNSFSTSTGDIPAVDLEDVFRNLL